MGGSMESCPGTPDSQGEPLVGSIAAPSTPGTPPPSINNSKCPVCFNFPYNSIILFHYIYNFIYFVY